MQYYHEMNMQGGIRLAMEWPTEVKDSPLIAPYYCSFKLLTDFHPLDKMENVGG